MAVSGQNPRTEDRSATFQNDVRTCQSNLNETLKMVTMFKLQSDAVCEDLARVLYNDYQLQKKALENTDLQDYAVATLGNLAESIPDVRILVVLIRNFLSHCSHAECMSLLNRLTGADSEIAPAIHTVSYVNNAMTREAVSKLIPADTHPDRLTCSGFADACEEVAGGNADACVLPVASSKEGRLMGFYSTIDSYELKISSICKIENSGSDENDFTFYALLRKELSLYSLHTDYSVVLQLYPDENFSPVQMLAVTDTSGLSVSLVDFLPGSVLHEISSGIVTLRGSNHLCISSMLLFLKVQNIPYTIIGIY